jgi:uncharacterized protein YyaL (SSP411 family)
VTTHIHFDDKGAVVWHSRYRDALAQAKTEDKLVLIEYGREACSSCRLLVEQVIPVPRIKDLLTDRFVCVVNDCDRPEKEVLELGAAHMSHARSLPFVMFTNADGKWLHGTQGPQSVERFEEELTLALRAAGRD